MALALSVAGCSHAPFYTGDGSFTDNGFMAYSRRYVVDLGPVDLSKPGAYSFSLSGLPRAEFVVTIHVLEEVQKKLDVRPIYPATVRIELRDSAGQVVVLEEAPLDSWVRGYALLGNQSELYRQGQTRELPLPSGGTRGERIGLKPSHGWGTYFFSEPEESYKLSFQVLSSSLNRPARIVVAGWSR